MTDEALTHLPVPGRRKEEGGIRKGEGVRSDTPPGWLCPLEGTLLETPSSDFCFHTLTSLADGGSGACGLSPGTLMALATLGKGNREE